MKPIYSIRDWDKDFENHESRKVRKVRWVPVPNKHDGKTYNRIARHPQAVDIFCGWNLILQVASKMPVRGILVDSDGPLDANDLADKTNFPVEIFEVALSVLVEPRYGWIDVHDANELPIVAPMVVPGEGGTSPGEEGSISRDNVLNRENLPANGPSLPASPGVPGGAGMEGKGREGKGREGAHPGPDLPFQGADFVKEWADYVVHRKQMRKPLTAIACQRLFKQFEQWGEARAVAALRYSMADGRTWQGVFEPRIPGAGVQAPMFKEAEPAEAKALRENCKRCNGTNTEIVPGMGARPCDHLAAEDL